MNRLNVDLKYLATGAGLLGLFLAVKIVTKFVGVLPAALRYVRPTNPPPDSELNEHQQGRLIVTCQYVDRLLADLERSFTCD